LPGRPSVVAGQTCGAALEAEVLQSCEEIGPETGHEAHYLGLDMVHMDVFAGFEPVVFRRSLSELRKSLFYLNTVVSL
jgi:hypothetical protein